MRKIKKSIIGLFAFMIFANKTYATTTGTYVVEESGSGVGKIILLLIALSLIGFVLFLGYKFDEKEASKVRKEKIKKQNKTEKKKDIKKEEYKENSETNEEFDKIYDNKMNIYSIDNLDENDKDTVEEKNEVEKEDVKEVSKNVSDDTIITNSIDINDEDIDIEDVFLKGYEDLIDFKEKEEDEKAEELIEKIAKPTASELTMVFDTDQVRKTDEVTKEDKEFLELLELEKTIAEANIKRYTRKKVEKPHIKRYTRKIVVEPKKRGRGRPRKTEKPIVVSAPRKRGRPRKEEASTATVAPKKRGRKPKNSEEVSVPKKRGRKPKNA